ncbi:hypothetical protein [Leuconostoc suionicum]|uniref:hypothetical protein n=2 Tax=Leuconostoc TaxID=1243 RepID=UPI0024ACF1FE|nr:hypothetical protein [Leuconostoc suionicum]MDI6523833.1 hypothetical protein [Leuconostoc suionicum]MDI6552088.1 hypothetical protein [Leuconostoc suionicum]
MKKDFSPRLANYIDSHSHPKSKIVTVLCVLSILIIVLLLVNVGFNLIFKNVNLFSKTVIYIIDVLFVALLLIIRINIDNKKSEENIRSIRQGKFDFSYIKDWRLFTETIRVAKLIVAFKSESLRDQFDALHLDFEKNSVKISLEVHSDGDINVQEILENLQKEIEILFSQLPTNLYLYETPGGLFIQADVNLENMKLLEGSEFVSYSKY